jgi:hypothetical protein
MKKITSYLGVICLLLLLCLSLTVSRAAYAADNVSKNLLIASSHADTKMSTLAYEYESASEAKPPSPIPERLPRKSNHRSLTKRNYCIGDQLFKSITLRGSADYALSKYDLTREQQILVVSAATRVNDLVSGSGVDEELECDVWWWGIQCINWPKFCYIDISSDGIDASCGDCTDPENGGCD